MKNIYVILSATPTMMGKFIRVFTRSSFNHSSISLTEGWEEMYSFARYRASNPLVGGFVKESPHRLTLGKSDQDVFVKVYKIPVSESQFEEIKMFIYSIRDDKEESIYNYFGALGILLGHKFDTYKAYTCSDFVAQTLSKGKVISDNYITKNIVPDEIQQVLDKYMVFCGYMKNYKPIKTLYADNDDFYIKIGLAREVLNTVFHFYNLLKRKNFTNVSHISKENHFM